LCWYVC